MFAVMFIPLYPEGSLGKSVLGIGWMLDNFHNFETALRLGNMAEFRRLRNAVNRERKTCRSKYYDGKVKHLKECSPADWWKEVKKLSGKENSTSSRDDVIKALKRLDGHEQSSDLAIANMVNETFFNTYERLASSTWPTWFEPNACLGTLFDC